MHPHRCLFHPFLALKTTLATYDWCYWVIFLISIPFFSFCADDLSPLPPPPPKSLDRLAIDNCSNIFGSLALSQMSPMVCLQVRWVFFVAIVMCLVGFFSLSSLLAIVMLFNIKNHRWDNRGGNVPDSCFAAPEQQQRSNLRYWVLKVGGVVHHGQIQLPFSCDSSKTLSIIFICDEFRRMALGIAALFLVLLSACVVSCLTRLSRNWTNPMRRPTWISAATLGTIHNL